jgi:hypothetical protein
MKRLSIIKFIPALILLILLLFVCYPFYPSIFFTREGLTSGSTSSSSSMKIGVYDFLAPPTDANKVTDDTFNKFLDVAPTVFCSLPKTTCANSTCTTQTPSDIDIQNCIPDQKQSISDQKPDLLQQVTNDEMAYYNQNLSWPYDGYVQSYIDNHPDEKTFFGTWDTAKKIFSNRTFYTMFFKTNEAKESPPGPLSYQIFMGTAQPPAPKTVSLTPSSITTS